MSAFGDWASLSGFGQEIATRIQAGWVRILLKPHSRCVILALFREKHPAYGLAVAKR
jgi:hypothetical protein